MHGICRESHDRTAEKKNYMPGLAGLEAVTLRYPKWCAQWPGANNALLAEVIQNPACPNIKRKP